MLKLKERLSKIEEVESEAGFTLLEMVLVITITALTASLFVSSAADLYKNHQFINLHSAWQLDGYLAVDFISNQLRNAVIVEIPSSSELEIFTYYDGDWQWLKFSKYYSSGMKKLGRAIGGESPDNKDIGRNSALLNDIDDIDFEFVDDQLLKIRLVFERDDKVQIISRLVNIKLAER